MFLGLYLDPEHWWPIQVNAVCHFWKYTKSILNIIQTLNYNVRWVKMWYREVTLNCTVTTLHKQ